MHQDASRFGYRVLFEDPYRITRKYETRNIGADIAPVQFRAANQRDDPVIFMSHDRACKG